MILKKEQNIYYVLRIAAAMCFIGHGIFGVITKAVWCNYFAVLGIGKDTAYHLMPLVGFIDITMGVSMLVYPLAIIALWLVVWGFITASLRPLSGEPFAEMLERTGNFGAPLALLMLCNVSVGSAISLKRLKAPIIFYNEKNVELCLRISAFLLLAGHGWLNLIGKQALLGQYHSLGIQDTGQFAFIIGCFEIAGAVFIQVKKLRMLILFFFFWKMFSEFFYPHYEVFEWIERGGSYGVLFSLWLVQSKLNKNGFHLQETI